MLGVVSAFFHRSLKGVFPTRKMNCKRKQILSLFEGHSAEIAQKQKKIIIMQDWYWIMVLDQSRIYRKTLES